MRIGWAGKVALGAVVPVLFGMGTFAVVELNHVRSVTLDQIRGDLSGVATVLAHTISGQELASPALAERVARLAATTHDRITIIDGSGAVLADSAADPAQMENHGTRPEVLGAKKDGIFVILRYSRTVRRDLLYAAARIPGTAAVARVARDLAGVEGELRQATGTFWIVAFLVCAISVAGALLIARGLARPIGELRSAAAAVEGGDLEARVHPRGEDAVAELGHAFNRMTARLRETIREGESEAAHLATILEGLTEGVLAVDADERISFVNTAARKILGIEPARRIEGLRIYEVVRDPRILAIAQTAASRKERADAEITLEGPPRRTLDVHAAPVGRVSDTILVLRDLSVLRRLERIRSDFVSNVSHELRTPLASIAAAVETLQDADTRMDAKDGPRFVEMVHRNVTRLEALINDILALSRLESRPDTLAMVPVDLATLARGAEEELGQRARAAAVGLTINGDPRVPVLGDAQTLRRVIDNLVVNAITYTPAGGKVRVRIYRSGDDAVLQVSDTGIGIPRSEQDRIFERFYRVDKARSRSVGGTGLGLAIVKHAIGLHGGRIEVESEPGRGSTFTARLPWSSKETS